MRIKKNFHGNFNYCFTIFRFDSYDSCDESEVDLQVRVELIGCCFGNNLVFEFQTLLNLRN